MENNEKLGNNPKKRSLKTKIVAPALAGLLAISSTAMAEQGEKIEEKRGNNKEIVVSSKEEKATDTTIDYNTARALNDNEKHEISAEEIREFFMNNKDEIMKNVNDITREKIYDELIRNRDIFKMVKKLTYDKEIREAALNGDNETIQKKVNKEIEKIKRINPDSFTIAGISLIIGMFVGYLICKKADKDYEKEKEEQDKNQ